MGALFTIQMFWPEMNCWTRPAPPPLVLTWSIWPPETSWDGTQFVVTVPGASAHVVHLAAAAGPPPNIWFGFCGGGMTRLVEEPADPTTLSEGLARRFCGAAWAPITAPKIPVPASNSCINFV